MEKCITFEGAEYRSVGDIARIPVFSNGRGIKRHIRRHGVIPEITQQHFNEVDIVSYSNVNLAPSKRTYYHAQTVSNMVGLMLQGENTDRPLVVADIGTGSGIVPIAIAAEHQAAIDDGSLRMIATDISGSVLEVASLNLAINGVSGVALRKRDLLGELTAEFGKLDVIFSNPPYLCETDIAPGYKTFGYTPELAINGGLNGLTLHERLFLQASEALSDDGIIVLQHRACQTYPVAALANKYMPGREVLALAASRSQAPSALVCGSADRLKTFQEQGIGKILH